MAKLPMKKIREDYSKYDEKIEIDFTDTEIDEEGKEHVKTYTIILEPFFKKTKIVECVEYLGELLKNAEEQKIEIGDKLLFPLIDFSCIKTFSNLTVPKNIDEHVNYFIQFYESRYFQEIIDYMLESELQKVYSKVFDLVEANDKLQRQFDKMKDEIMNMDIENPELREKVQGKKKQIPEV